ncbi:MAG TPA: hypothetical protein ENH82_14115, partial [bacterium]|nr:hypothetical protein [bacterium]
MRNILYILLLISGTVFGQTEFDDVTSTPSSSASDETIIVRSSTTYRTTRAVQQENLLDSIVIHLGRLDDGVDTMGVHLDTLQQHRDDIQIVTALATTYTYNATRLNVVASDGFTGHIDSLFAVDGDVVQVEEKTGAPGFDIRVTYTGVLSFNNIEIYHYYHGGALHSVHTQLWNPNTSAWVQVDEFSDEGQFDFNNIGILNGADYIDDDSVIVRLYHDDAGNPSHFIEIDYMVIKQQPSIGGAGVTDHFALQNKGTIPHAAIEDSIQIGTDTAAVHDGKINTNIQGIADNSDSITIHRDDLDSLFSLIAILIGDAENPFPAPSFSTDHQITHN